MGLHGHSIPPSALLTFDVVNLGRLRQAVTLCAFGVLHAETKPRSGSALQPNVAACRLRWVRVAERTQPHRSCGVVHRRSQGSRAIRASTLGSEAQPLRG